MPDTRAMTELQMTEISDTASGSPMGQASTISPQIEPLPQMAPKVEMRSNAVEMRPNLAPLVKKDISMAPADYIKPSLIRYAQYEYKTGTTFFLSKTEQICVDAYLRTNNEAEAVRTLNAIYTAHGSPRRFGIKAVHRWLRKPHIARYIADKFISEGKVNWMDQKRWEAWGVDAMQGAMQPTQTQVAVWKEFGKARGWYAETGPTVMHNTQINFTQSTGQA